MKHALRLLGREKAFTCFAVLTLALGIGAVTTIFSVVEGVLLRPLRYKNPGELYAAAEFAPQFAKEYPKLPVNAAHFRIWREQCKSCTTSALLQPASFNVTGSGEPERVDGVNCTWQLFEVLGVRAKIGRTFVESDDQPGNNKYVVIADSLWRRRLNADPEAAGKSILLYGESHVIVGVLPADFRFPGGEQFGSVLLFPKRTEIFKPLGLNWAKAQRVGSHNYSAVIRLSPGVSGERAQSQMTAALAEVSREMGTELKAIMTPLHEQVTGGSQHALWFLLSAVGAVLLIVCVNLGNLMLVRASGRMRDAAIRRALGAGAGQLVRTVMTESLLIAFAGGALGVVLANIGVRILVAIAPIDIPRLDEVGVNAATLLFAFCVAGFCGVLCGLWPAFRLTRAEPGDVLKSGSRSSTEAGSRVHARELLVGVEVALSTVLLIVAGLLGVSFLRLMNVQRGFDVERILTADLTLPGSRYQKEERKLEFHRQMIEKLENTPGVRSAALISSLPLKAQNWGDIITKEGETRPMVERPLAQFRFVSPHYFDAMAIALRRGRMLAETDRQRKVAMVSESVARSVWPGEDAIGKRIQKSRIGGDPKNEWVEVVGVVGDVRTESLEKKPPLLVYVPYWDGQYWQGGLFGDLTFMVQTAQDPAMMAGMLRQTVRELDAELPLANVRTMREIMSESVGRRRFQAVLAMVFAVSALLLACLGIYGVISYAVARRRNEMGIRMALGAQASQVIGMIMKQGMRPVVAGLILGVMGALGAGALLSSLVFGVGARDPQTIAAVTIVLALVAAAACWIPARRASRIDPADALRYE
jgi:putative ABC transport system permease protein